MSDSDSKDIVKALLWVSAETVVFLVIFRVLSRPDTVRTTSLRVLKMLESGCERNARYWASSADIFGLAYESSRAGVS